MTRFGFLFLLPLFAAGCVDPALRGSFGPGAVPPAEQLAPRSAERLEASLIQSGASGQFVLLEDRDGIEFWQAIDGSALALRDGIVVSTFALGFDLATADVADVANRFRTRQSGAATRVHRYLDGENQTVARVFNCEVEIGTARNSSRFGGQVRSVTEACSGPLAAFENVYVVNNSGQSVASTQWVSPEIGYVRLAPPNATSAVVVPQSGSN